MICRQKKKWSDKKVKSILTNSGANNKAYNLFSYCSGSVLGRLRRSGSVSVNVCESGLGTGVVGLCGGGAGEILRGFIGGCIGEGVLELERMIGVGVDP